MLLWMLLLFVLWLLLAVHANANLRGGRRRELFPILNWTLVDDGPDNYTARHECSFVKAGNKFFLMGGRATEMPRTIDVFDLESFLWVQEDRALAPQELNHFQALEYEGLIWVIGAFSTNTRPEEDAQRVYVYDVANDVWLDGPTIPSARRRGSGGLVIYNDNFYLVGGNNNGHDGGYVNYFDRYNPRTSSWSRMSQDAPRERDHFHSVVCQGKLYAVGGRLSGGDGGTFAPLIPEVDVFDFATNSWSTLPPELNLPTPRAGTTTVCYQDRFVIVIGGESRFTVYDDVQAFDVELQQWQALALLNVARHGTQAILVEDTIFLAAGSPRWGGGRIHEMEVYGSQNVSATAPSSAGELEIVSVSSTEVLVRHFNGTQGVFVTSVDVDGDYSLGTYPNGVRVRVPSLVAIGETRTFTVACASDPCEAGNFTLVHSGGQVLTATLPSPIETTAIAIDAGSVLNDRRDWITTTAGYVAFRLSADEVEVPYNTMSLARYGGNLSYTIPELPPGGSYIVTLGWRRHICDRQQTPNIEVTIQGIKVESSLALACQNVTVQSYNSIVDDSGNIQIDFIPKQANRNPFVNFIEVTEGSIEEEPEENPSVIQLDAGSSTDQRDWISVTTGYFAYRYTGVEAPYNSLSMARYAGILTYTIPGLAASANYTIDLGWYRPLCSTNQSPQLRVEMQAFVVASEVITECQTILVNRYPDIESDANGTIEIDFISLVSNRNPFINYIEVFEGSA